MKNVVRSWRGWLIALTFVLGMTSLVLAQLADSGAPKKGAAPIMEFTQQDVQPALLVESLNEMGKQHWEIFQITPTWGINQVNGETQMAPKSYQVFGRRPIEAPK